ncbi:hypothetical protein [Roseibium sp. RKSG952]|uniref:phage tail assembly chaperone n=1 Tax=Roseibium sp. RKSG952 TaxID=2529384 RepID=UPI0012BC1CE7|nr:hypothetical protein [Roseibium sp. RKSG952]MTH96422.1 hypothetical protein [Roseibium sp. RKSG952]
MTLREDNELNDMEDLNPPVVAPIVYEHPLLWAWFWHLDGTRQEGMNGPQAFSYLEIEAWIRLAQPAIRREDVATLLAMDRAYISEYRAVYAERQERQRKRQEVRQLGKG